LPRHASCRERTPFEESFTAEISFHGGSYRVLLGGAAGAAAGCQLVLAAVNRLVSGPGADYASEVLSDATALLKLSDEMCRRAGLERWEAPAFSPRTPMSVLPDSDLRRLEAAVTFSEDDLEQMLGSAAGLVRDLVVPGALGVVDDESEGPTDDRIYLYPLARLTDGDLVVALASGLATAITHRALCRAVDLDLIPSVTAELHSAVQGTADRCARRLGWVPVPEPDGVEAPILFREAFYRFDDDKLAHVVSAVDPLDDYRPGHPFDVVDVTALNAELHSRFPAVRGALRAQHSGLSVLHLICHAPLGMSSSIGFRDEAIDEGSTLLYLRTDDFDVMSRVEAPDPLAPWKFARAAWQLREASRVISFSALDEYAIYKENGGGFYMSDEAKPTGITVSPGSAGPLRVGERRRVDQHLVRLPDSDDFVEVARWSADDNSPVYQPEVPTLRSYHLVELSGPCWVVPIPTSPGEEDMTGELAQAVAFWLWRCRDFFEEPLLRVLRRIAASSWR
jgi:hypothetical protein